MATSGNSKNSPKEGTRYTNISLTGCINTQVGEKNVMVVGGERYSNTSQKHTASNNTRSPTLSHESETTQTYQSSTESLSETRHEMMANEEIPEGRTDSGAIDSNYDAALSADNTPRKQCMNISLKDCRNTQVGENNEMIVGGESNTSQKHTASNDTRSSTRNHESETNKMHLSSTESPSETRSEMIANEKIRIGITKSEAIDSNNDAAISADNNPSDIRDSGNDNTLSHICKTHLTLQHDYEKDKKKGALLRKSEDTSFSYEDGEIIYIHEKLSKRIGCIKVTYIKENQGTGFRVGSKYFMTAFHVIEDVLTQFWIDVYGELTDEERMQMEWTENKIPIDGAWTLSKLWPSLNQEKKNKLIEIGKQYITKRIEIKFGFVNDNDRIILGQCSYEVAFASPSHDVVILELIEDTNLTNPFHLIKVNAAATKLHLIGHPGGKKLTHDPACTIMKDQEELDKLIKRGISFFTKLGLPKEQVEKDYEPCVLSPDHLLFHCSESISHGASGSPLIVTIKEKKAQVIGMLLRGHPKFCYNYDKVKGDRPDLLVESGISMEKVHSLLNRHSLKELAEHLFQEQF